MKRNDMITLACKVNLGGFPSERVFRIALPGGKEHVGVGSAVYFYNEDGELLTTEVIPAFPDSISARVAARVVDVKADGTLLVSVPSGATLRLPQGSALGYPTQDEAHVPV